MKITKCTVTRFVCVFNTSPISFINIVKSTTFFVKSSKIMVIVDTIVMFIRSSKGLMKAVKIKEECTATANYSTPKLVCRNCSRILEFAVYCYTCSSHTAIKTVEYLHVHGVNIFLFIEFDYFLILRRLYIDDVIMVFLIIFTFRKILPFKNGIDVKGDFFENVDRLLIYPSFPSNKL